MVKAHTIGKGLKMKQLLGLLFVSLLGGSWLSLKVVQCTISQTRIPRPKMQYCFNTSSGKTCLTTLLVDSRTARKPFEEASHWCKTYVPGSSLIVINSLEIQTAFQGFIWRQVLEYDAIIMDAQMLSANESQKWSWVNGQPYSPDVAKDISRRANRSHDGACVESKSKPSKSVNYCFGNVASMFRYICELSDSKSASSYRQGNKSYVASEGNATWYDARKECLRLNGDLASITDLRTIISWPSLKENQPYWIGLHRNKWIWNSTGAALTYTNWKNGFPEESFDKQCICFSPKCNREKENTTPICDKEYDHKWRTCNCSRSNYVIVCQREENIPSSTSADFKSSVTLSAETTTKLRLSSSSIPFSASASTTTKAAASPTIRTAKRTSSQTSTAHTYSTTRTTIMLSTKATTNTTPAGTTPTTTTFKPVIPIVTIYATTIANHTSKQIVTKTASTSSMIQEPSNHFSEHQTTVFASTSLANFHGQLNSFNANKVILVLVLFVAVVCIIVAVILVIRKRKYDRRNEGSPTRYTAQSETVSTVYATVVPDSRPSEVTVPPCNAIYAEVEMIKQTTPPSNNTIYASVQPTSEAIDIDKSTVVYADLDYPKKDQQKPRSGEDITACLSPIYSQPYEPSTSATNTEYAEPFKPDKRPTATAPVLNHHAAGDQQNIYSLAKAIPLSDPKAIYSEPDKPTKSRRLNQRVMQYVPFIRKRLK